MSTYTSLVGVTITAAVKQWLLKTAVKFYKFWSNCKQMLVVLLKGLENMNRGHGHGKVWALWGLIEITIISQRVVSTQKSTQF